MRIEEINKQLEQARKAFLSIGGSSKHFVEAADSINKFGVSMERCVKVFSSGNKVIESRS